MNYLFIGDSPTLTTGLANVARNITTRLSFKDQIHFWGVGYDGNSHNFPFQIYQANPTGEWSDQTNIKRLAEMLHSFSGDTRIFAIQDPWRLEKLCPAIDQYKTKSEVNVISYIPVDSPLTELDRPFLSRVDFPVAYTRYGEKELKGFVNKPINIIPHGLEVNNFECLGKQHRKELFSEIPDEGILLTNVNTNSLRKANDKSLFLLKELLKYKAEYYLYMHCVSEGEYNLKQLAIELQIQDRVFFIDKFTKEKKHCDQETLNKIYCCSDLVISTSLGEGWGFSAFESSLCGVPVALPMHSSFREMFNEESCIALEAKDVVNVRDKEWPSINIEQAAKQIHEEYSSGGLQQKVSKAQTMCKQFTWERVMPDWERVFKKVIRSWIAIH